MKKIIAALAVAFVAAGTLAAAVAIGGRNSSALHITSAAKSGGCVSGLQAYTVGTRVDVTNGGKGDATVVDADWSVRAKHTKPYGFKGSAALAGGTLVSGHVAAGATTSFTADVLALVSCGTTEATLCVKVELAEQHGSKLHHKTTKKACAEFISSGVAVPAAGTTGLIGLTLVLGAGLVFAQLRSRRRNRGQPGPA